MQPTDIAELKKREEQKREAMWDPAQRWQVLQAMIAWCDSQAAVGRNTPQTCLRLQAAKLRSMRRSEPSEGGCGA